MPDVSLDFRVGLRRLLHDRSLTLTASLTLAFGIGLNLVVFSFLDAAVLRPLPFADPSRVVHVTVGAPLAYDACAHQLRPDTRSLSGLLASVPFQQFTFHGQEALQKVSVEVVSDNYFSVLGIAPAAGRLFADDGRADADGASVAVVSYAFWQNALRADSRAVGARIKLDEDTFTIVGIAANGFPGIKHLHTTDIWCRIEDPVLSRYRSAHVEMLGRLAPGASPSQVQHEVTIIAAKLGLVDSHRPRVRVAPESQFSFSEGLLAIVAICMCLPFIVLVMACANISILMLARSEHRTQEIATRLAIGGNRAHLIRQLLVETLLLAVVAGVLALAVTRLVMSALPSLLPANLPSMHLDVRIDWRMLSAVAAFTLIATLATGLSPAIRATDLDLVTALKSGWDGRRKRRRRLMGRSLLITAHIAVSIALLTITALLAQGAMDLSRKALGFSPDGIVVVATENDVDRVAVSSLEEQYRTLAADIGRMPGVRRVSRSTAVPFDGSGWPTITYTLPREGAVDARAATVSSNTVDARFFDVMGIPVVEGRSFSDADDVLAPRVVVVSRKMAEMNWPGKHPEGRQMLIDRQPYEVIGVVGDIEGALPARIGVAPPPCVYFHAKQSALTKRIVLSVQVDRDEGALGGTLHERLFSASARGIRPAGVVSLRRGVEDGVSTERSVALYLASMGVLALLLAVTGIYNLISYNASRLKAEIGIRKALGASPRSLVWMMLARPLAMGTAGTVVAWPIAFVASRSLGSLFYGMKAPNVLAFGVPPLVLAIAIVCAGYLPAHWASRMDPIKALRWE